MINVLEINHLTKDVKLLLMDLWNNEYPTSLKLNALTDFEAYLTSLENPIHYLLKDNEHILGWFVEFKRGGQTWFAMIIHRSYHHQGFGSKLLQQAKERHQQLFGWVIDRSDQPRNDGTNYPSPVLFYQRNQFVINAEVRLELPTISAVQIEWNRSV